MGYADFLSIGDYNFICDQCGFKYKGSMGRMQWNNLFVCPDCYEERHPQDFVKGVRDRQRVPIARPDSEPVFITTPVTRDDF